MPHGGPPPRLSANPAPAPGRTSHHRTGAPEVSRSTAPAKPGPASPDGDTSVEQMLQSAAAPSPFPPIAEYAFLSDCHTGALVAPDGVGRLVVRPTLRLAQRVRQPARPRGGLASGSALRHQRADRAPLRPGHERAGDDVAHARPAGSSSATPSPSGPRRGEDTITPAHAPAGRRRRRPHAGAHRRRASTAASRSSSCASRSSTTGAPRRRGRCWTTTATRRRHRRRLRPSGCAPTCARHRGRARPRPPRAAGGRAALLRALVGRGARRRRPTSTRPRRA